MLKNEAHCKQKALDLEEKSRALESGIGSISKIKPISAQLGQRQGGLPGAAKDHDWVAAAGRELHDVALGVVCLQGIWVALYDLGSCGQRPFIFH